MEALPPRHIAVDLMPRTVSGGLALNGSAQVISSDAGVWLASFSEIPVNTQQGQNRITLWRAISGMAEGRLNPILIGAWDSGAPEIPASLASPITHSDGATFSDGAGYAQSIFPAFTSDAYPVRATRIRIDKAQFTVQPGYRFSIGERLYQVKAIVAQTSSFARFDITPPLREAVPANASVEFAKPVLRVRLATDGEMKLPLDYGRWSFPTVNFIEDI